MPLEFDGVNGIVKNTTSDGDVTIKGNDGGSEISALTFDMSAEGVATFNKDIKIGDSGKALFGAGSDLQIYHDGTNSYIQDEGTGDLKITSNGNAISFQKGTSETMAFFDTDAGCELYHDNVARFVTDSAGANVTGTLDVSSKVVVAGGTEATTTSDGSIATAGGLSVTKDTVMGDDLKMLSDGAVIHFGADSEVTLTHVADAGLALSSAGNLDTLSLISTDGDANIGPNLRLYRNSGSPADSDSLGMIDFEGRNDNSQDVIYGQIETLTTDVSDGAEDGYMNLSVMLAGTLRSRIEMDSGETVINEASQDLNFRVESNGNANMLFVDAGNDKIGIGTNSPSQTFSVAGNMDISATSRLYLDGGGDTFIEEVSGNTIAITTNNSERMRIHSGGNISIGTTTDPAKLSVRTADSSAGPNSDADELFIEGSGNAGMTIGSGTSSSGNIHFADNGDNDRGIISYNHSTDDMFFSTNGNGSAYALVLHDSNAISTSGETSPDVGEGGITLDQNANDGKILTFKSSDVAHGITNEAETDTYAAFDKNSSAEGGLDIVAFSERTDGEFLRLVAAGTSIQTTKSTSAIGAMHFVAVIKNGTAFAGCDADDNLLTLSNGANTRFIFDNEGTMHSDVGTATYDKYEDAHLVRAMDLSTSTKGLIASKFDEFVQYNHEDLANASIVGRDENGTPNTMVNWTAMSQLHNGAIWQQYEKHEKLASAFYKLAKKTIGKEEADKLLTEEEIQLLN